ncbi:hypothetical protein GCM10009715_29460 [Paeniglutamicibacter psychrophenolicus]|uniref:MarR family transcriptional regulator n=1 Tax=Paeniglutamicibacter psychrophenolicus TaxID=257454 RepID=A0ABS4W8J9_9MICC|nr:hypothetical protein [Paeniglutamicibacter psychrophenolicus]
MYVVTLKQRDRRADGDLGDEMLRTLSHVPTLAPFQRSGPAVLVGVPERAEDAVDAVLRALRSHHWVVGLGVGSLYEPVPREAQYLQGTALGYAHTAVERSEHTGERIPLSVVGPEAAIAGEAEAVLRLLGQIVSTRSVAEWAVLDLLTPGVRGQQKHVAAELGISAQAVSKAVVRSAWVEEWAARPAAARLLRGSEFPDAPAGAQVRQESPIP